MRVPVPVSSDGLEVVLNALDGAIFALNNSSVELIESPRRLSELNESGFLYALDQIAAGVQPNQGFGLRSFRHRRPQAIRAVRPGPMPFVRLLWVAIDQCLRGEELKLGSVVKYGRWGRRRGRRDGHKGHLALVGFYNHETTPWKGRSA